MQFNQIIIYAAQKGHDSVIIKNTYDGGGLDDVYVLLKDYVNRGRIKNIDAVNFNPNSNKLMD